MKLKIALLAATIFVTPAQAATTIWTGTGATDTLSWAQLGPVNTLVSSGTSITSVGGIAGTVVSSTTLQLERRDQGNGWSGNFTNGTPLLFNRGSAGDIIVNFAPGAVSAIGAQFQADFFGAFVARVTTNDGSFFDVAGNSTGNGDNSAVFIGAQSNTSSITSIIFHQLSGGGNNDFAISGLSLVRSTISAVPEPATWGMMIMGFGMVGGAMRRRRPKITVSYA